MALVQEKVILSIVLVDAAGNKSNMLLELQYADLAALNTGHTTNDEIFGVGGIVPLLEAVTQATVLSVTMAVKYGENSAFYGAAGSEVENVALITAQVAGVPGKKVNLRIPAPEDGIFLDTSGENRNIVDTADADAIAWLALFEVAATPGFDISDGENIADSATAGNWKGKRIHRGSRVG